MNLWRRCFEARSGHQAANTTHLLAQCSAFIIRSVLMAPPAEDIATCSITQALLLIISPAEEYVPCVARADVACRGLVCTVCLLSRHRFMNMFLHSPGRHVNGSSSCVAGRGICQVQAYCTSIYMDAFGREN